MQDSTGTALGVTVLSTVWTRNVKSVSSEAFTIVAEHIVPDLADYTDSTNQIRVLL